MRNPKKVFTLALLGGVSLALGGLILLFGGRPLLFGSMVCWGVGAVLGLLALSFATRKRTTGRAIRRGLLALLVLGLAAFGGLEWVVLSYAKDSPPPSDPEAVIVLGAAVWEDRPSPVLQKRLDTAAEWLLAHPEVPVVVSGGVDTGETRSEAAVMAEALERAGIDPSRIYLEEQATNTLENLTLSTDLLRQEGIGASSLLVVSSAPHLARVQLLAERLSLSVGALASEDPGGASYRVYLYLREGAALVKSFLFDHP